MLKMFLTASILLVQEHSSKFWILGTFELRACYFLLKINCSLQFCDIQQYSAA